MNTTTLLEHFAAHESLAEYDHPESEGPNSAFCQLLAGPRPDKSWETAECWEWEAKWRAKLRFIRARAMVEEAERIRAESQTIYPEQLRQTEEVTRMFSEQSMDMKAATPQTSNPDMPHMDRCPVCNGWQFGGKCPNRGCPRRHEETPPPKTSNLSFSQALEAMKHGKKIKRPEWIDWIETGVKRHLGTWDILANDWEILP